MRCQPGLLGDEDDVEILNVCRLGDGHGRRSRDDAELGLGLGEHNQDLQPAVEPTTFVEHRSRLVGAPQMGVGAVVAQAGSHETSAR